MTKIFKDRYEFFIREDKTVNGVSEYFASENPDWEEENKSNEGCWNCSDCSGCSGCSDCSGCSRCSGCSGCSRCSRCSGCSDMAPAKIEPAFSIPVIENIHSEVLKAASNPKALDMSTWHTCDTTHCRAGWVVFLAGKEGKELEEKTSTLFAAMQIYHKSSEIKVSPPRFYESNEVAMADMKRCAELETIKP